MKCPHCDTGIFEAFQQHKVNINGLLWTMFFQPCPECQRAIIDLEAIPAQQATTGRVQRYTAYPASTSPRQIAAEVIDPYRQDFVEACAVLAISPKASAAISRRNLQAILRDKAGTKAKDLYDQIEEVIGSGGLPSHIADDLHAVRNIGNFAAHEIKSKVTGAIVEVATGEAEWNLDVIESLFDFYFVEPTKAAKRKAALNIKLKEAGKPEIP